MSRILPVMPFVLENEEGCGKLVFIDMVGRSIWRSPDGSIFRMGIEEEQKILQAVNLSLPPSPMISDSVMLKGMSLQKKRADATHKYEEQKILEQIKSLQKRSDVDNEHEGEAGNAENPAASSGS